jgi:hypothetical protein
MSRPSPAPGLRRWLLPSLKAALAVAGLTALAQWVTPMMSERGRTVAATAVTDPVVTGSLRAKPAVPVLAQNTADLDRRGLLSLVSQSQGDAPRTLTRKSR